MATATHASIQPETQDVYARYSLQESWQHTQEEYTLRSLQKLADISADKQVESLETGVENLTENGNLNGTHQLDINHRNWSKHATELSSEIQETRLEVTSVEAYNFTLNTSSNLTVDTEKGGFTARIESSTEIKQVKDPLLDEISYQTEIEACNFNKLAERVSTAEWNGTARGKPVKKAPGNIDSPYGEKILVTTDITQYDNDTTRQLAGYVSETDPTRPGKYNDNYVVGVSSTPDFENRQNALINDGLWKTNFERVIEARCYLSTSLDAAPSVKNRIEDRSRGENSQGIFTVLNASEVGETTDSDIGYERVNSTGLNLEQIEGISTGEGLTWPYFRMSQKLAEQHGLGDLID